MCFSLGTDRVGVYALGTEECGFALHWGLKERRG